MLAHPQEQAGGSDGEQEWWMLDLSPNSDVDESAQSEQGQETQMITTQVLLTLLILPAFFAMAYQEDVVRLAKASRVALEPIVVESLAFIRYIVMEFREWLEDWYAERSARLDYLDNLDAREDST